MVTVYPIQKTLASLIFLFRKKSIRASSPRFLLFTGTSGKTLTRDFVAYGLKKLGRAVVSPNSGYTNELGVVLASLGIEDFSFRSIVSWKKLITSSALKQSFVCLELGADFRKDIPWFLKRFEPYAVFLTGMDSKLWADQQGEVRSEQVKLIECIPTDGILVYDKDNVVANELLKNASLICRIRESEQPKTNNASLHVEQLVEPSIISVYIDGEKTNFNVTSYIFEPQERAVRQAVLFLELLSGKKVGNNFFLEYVPLRKRLSVRKTSLGTIILADTYKAVPLCTKWFLEFASEIVAKRKILILSEMRPEPYASRYNEIRESLKNFEEVYFIGRKSVFTILSEDNQKIVYLGKKDYQEVIRGIVSAGEEGDLILIKGAERYKLDTSL